MQIALTVDQAAKAGIIPYTSDLPASFFKAADSQKERVLLDSMNPDSEYPEVLEQVKGELAKLDLSTSVPPSNL